MGMNGELVVWSIGVCCLAGKYRKGVGYERQ